MTSPRLPDDPASRNHGEQDRGSCQSPRESHPSLPGITYPAGGRREQKRLQRFRSANRPMLAPNFRKDIVQLSIGIHPRFLSMLAISVRSNPASRAFALCSLERTVPTGTANTCAACS
jgi:hypothetical protein